MDIKNLKPELVPVFETVALDGGLSGDTLSALIKVVAQAMSDDAGFQYLESCAGGPLDWTVYAESLFCVK